MTDSTNIPIRRSWQDAFQDHVINGTAPTMSHQIVPLGGVTDYDQLTSERAPHLSDIVEFLHEGEPDNSVDHIVPQQTGYHDGLSSSSYPDSQLYHFNGEPYPKRQRNSNSFSSMTEQTDSLQPLNYGLEHYTDLNNLDVHNINFHSNTTFPLNPSPPANVGNTSGSMSFSKQPGKHRPQYPNSEGSRGFVKSRANNKNQPTQLQFHDVEGIAKGVKVEIYDADAKKLSEDYTVVELKKKSGGTRSGDQFHITNSSTHDLDYVGIQVQGVEERGNLKKRAKECRMKVTCTVQLESGEQYQLSAISHKFNCSQESSSQITKIEPKAAKRLGGHLMLIEGKNLKDDSIVVFERTYRGRSIFRMEVKPKAVTKNFMVVIIPPYNGPFMNSSSTVDVSVQGGSSNVTNTVELQYLTDEHPQFSGIKRERGVDNLRGPACPYTQSSGDYGYGYQPSGSSLSAQIHQDNELIIPGHTE